MSDRPVFWLLKSRCPSTVPVTGSADVAWMETFVEPPDARVKMAGVAVIATGTPMEVAGAVTVNVSVAFETLVMFRVVDRFKVLPGTFVPKLIEAGLTVAGLANAAATSSNPLP